MPVLTPYRRLFSDLHAGRIGHSLWKNLTEVPAALQGTGDLDLYVRPATAAAFRRALGEHGFLRAHSRYAYPDVEHHYAWDEVSGRFCHLHVYFRLVTGESHLKQYCLPIEAYLQEWPPTRREDGLLQPDPEVLRRLHLFRRRIKLSCLPGLFLYARERHGYTEETAHLEALASSCSTLEPARLQGWLSSVVPGEPGADGLVAEARRGLRHRFELSGLSRFTPAGAWARRYAHLVLRPLNKLRRRRKRPDSGRIIAIVGLDGSGKSTAVDMLADWLGAEFDVRRVHYGHGRSTLASVPVRLALRIRQAVRGGPDAASAASATPAAMARPKDTQSLIAHARYLALAIERRAVAATALRAAARGELVISDRWYSLDGGKMDSARLDPEGGSVLKRRMARWENRLYRTSPDPDLLLKMRVGVDVALQRNRERDKIGKESDEQIVERFRVNDDLAYRCVDQVMVDNRRSMPEVHRQLREEVWTLLLGRRATP